MATYPVKFINNGMRGAPQVSGTAGTLLTAIRAFLLTGFGTVTAISVTVAGGIATASLQAGQSFDKNCVVLVDGATPAALNGENRVLTTSNASITWATTAADGVATGAITIKVAPVGGWEELFAGTVTNKAVFRSTHPQASGFCLWIDDTGTMAARVRGYESMTDVVTGIGPFPTDAQISGGGYWVKSTAANTNAVRYDMFADARTLISAIAAGSSGSAASSAAPLRGFGDMLPLRASGDVYSCALSCNGSVATATAYPYGSFDYVSSGTDGVYMPRAISGIGSAVQVASATYAGSTSPSGADATLGAFPSQVDGELKYSRRFLPAADGKTPRVDIPAVLHIPQSGVTGSVAPRDILAGAGALAGRLLMATGTTNTSPGAPVGIALVDITGPWR